MTQEQISKIILENEARRQIMFAPYNPATGENSPIERVRVQFFHNNIHYNILFPVQMYTEQPLLRRLAEKGSVEATLNTKDFLITQKFMTELNTMRFDYDFEFWAFSCVKVQDKESKREIPFTLNRPQRKVLARYERMRLAKVPIRIILLKARQWGGSTLTQIYMAWMQLRLRLNWHSAIVAQTEDQSRNIRGMYRRLSKNYPSEFGTVTFVPYEGSSKNKIVRERNSIIGVGSAEKPDNLRSFDFSMLHMSEVGLWKSTLMRSAEDLAQSIRSTVPTIPDSMIVLESTAKGVGTFFHNEWMTAKKGKSSYDPVFIPWFDIERYQKSIADEYKEEFVRWVMSDPYARYLWSAGATLEGIRWYYDYKTGENYDDWRMNSEFPSNDVEAFQSTGSRVFNPDYVAKSKKTCEPPLYVGNLMADSLSGPDSLKNITFVENPKGNLSIWSMPDKTEDVSNRYALFADIGGRTAEADYSCIRVIDRYWMMMGGVPEIVATWHGHIDQDIFAWIAAQLALFYNNGLLAIETNSLRTKKTEGDHFITILDEIAPHYRNLFARTDPEKIKQKAPIKWGFHTNQGTKSLIINTLNAALRDETYIEKDIRACHELDTLEYKIDGSIGAVDGSHDDIAITTAGVVWLALKYMSLPAHVKVYKGSKDKQIQSEASF